MCEQICPWLACCWHVKQPTLIVWRQRSWERKRSTAQPDRAKPFRNWPHRHRRCVDGSSGRTCERQRKVLTGAFPGGVVSRWSKIEIENFPPSVSLFGSTPLHSSFNRLVGLVVKASASRAEIPGLNHACAGIFSGSSHTSDWKIGTPVSTLPGAWRYRVSAGTGRPGVSILWLGEMESLICSFQLSVAARKIVCADPSLRYTGMLLGP